MDRVEIVKVQRGFGKTNNLKFIYKLFGSTCTLLCEGLDNLLASDDSNHF